MYLDFGDLIQNHIAIEMCSMVNKRAIAKIAKKN